MAGSNNSTNILTTNTASSSSEDDLLSFTEVRNAAAEMNNKQNFQNTNAHILRMYDTSQSGGQYGAVLSNRMRPELPYAHTPGMLPARPQPYQINQGMSVMSHFTNNNFGLINNNRVPGVWGNQRGPMQQLPNLTPRMTSNNHHYSPHMAAMHPNKPTMATTSHSSGNTDVPNANSLDLLRF